MEPIKAENKNFWPGRGNGPPAEKTKRLGRIQKAKTKINNEANNKKEKKHV